jgi:hypothetical protein
VKAWEEWWKEHAGEFPPQLDPDTIAVGPITSWSDAPRAR